jgi:hypothetical protein
LTNLLIGTDAGAYELTGEDVPSIRSPCFV